MHTFFSFIQFKKTKKNLVGRRDSILIRSGITFSRLKFHVVKGMIQCTIFYVGNSKILIFVASIKSRKKFGYCITLHTFCLFVLPEGEGAK